MRVLFTVSSWSTHYSTMIAVGWAAQAMGHEVRVLCPASETTAVSNTGLIPVPVLDGVDIVTSNRLEYYREAAEGRWRYPWLPLHPLTGEPLRGLDEFDLAEYRRTVEPELAARAARGFDAAVEYARRWRPDVVLHDPTSLEGLLAARVVGVPALLCLWGPVGTHEPEHRRIVPTDISGSFARHGVGEFSLDLITHVVDPCPAAVAPPVGGKRVPLRYVPYNGCAPEPAWLHDAPARPRVCIAWSTALSTMSGPNSYLLPELISSLDGLDLEVIVTATATDVAALGTVPAGVRVLERMPLRLLLPGCAAIVHHGGSGNTMTALVSGTPQLPITFTTETTVTAERLHTAGVGSHLQGNIADRQRVRDAVLALVYDPGYRARAGEVRDEIRLRPTPVDLVTNLEKLAGG
ncbi:MULTISPECIES: nucleotide disphospho-sugar-binding domain-containing protein [unclassified Micromonospora]|uniref:nucleotide disphospho-sugar-binding domain-containing protein n=1 Tax=unclassified Micromonospora TaxID=2617518 RepID=UPI003A8A79F5